MRLNLSLVCLCLLTAVLSGLQGCTCCAYYNHMWNAHEAYEEAGEQRTARQDSLPGDTSRPMGPELKLYDRVIEKGSRTLERFPDNTTQAAMAVFLIAESFRHKQEWPKAIVKYDEFERYFSKHDSMPTVEYQRAWSLYRNKDYSIARFATERILAAGTKHPYYVQALNLMSLLQEQANFPQEAIAALEQLLASPGGTPFLRAKAHLRLADLYFAQQQWIKARTHYQAPEVAQLEASERFLAAKNAAECLYQQKSYAQAADEYANLAKLPENKPWMAEISIRQGELRLLSGNWTEGDRLLRQAAHDYTKSEFAARAFFDLGDFDQMNRKDYPAAIANYDSSYQAKSSSTWGRTSKERRDALANLDKRRQNVEKAKEAKQPFFNDEFQIAELFLFKLSETDSALATLDRIVASPGDSLIAQRAAYARAFIYDEFKQDSLKADSLYRDLIARYPHSPYARQAQENLGLKVTVQTREDEAHGAFLKAESLWVAVQAIPSEDIAATDAAWPGVIAAYDSVYQLYPETNEGVHALYAKALLLENELREIDSAKVAYVRLREKHSQTAWGKAADAKLSGRVSISDQELEQSRKRVKMLEESTEKMRKRYQEEAEKQKQLQIKKPDADDEELQDDYNSLYDFQ